jgi:protocatechuate 3,4-dioxygenase beta subunit
MRIRLPEGDVNPPLAHKPYGSTGLRAPAQKPLRVAQGPTELAAPRFDESVLFPNHDDLTRQMEGGEPLGERIVVGGRVIDENGAPLANTLVEIWQCNAAGRYRHAGDQHPAPLDPHFQGGGRVFTDKDGGYRFTTIKPGAYPWKNHANAWRPAHIHFSVFGSSWVQRLVTQMYFPGDPLLGIDPVFNSVPSESARDRLVSRFDLELTKPEWALGYRFDVVLRGSEATPGQP